MMVKIEKAFIFGEIDADWMTRKFNSTILRCLKPTFIPFYSSLTFIPAKGFLPMWKPSDISTDIPNSKKPSRYMENHSFAGPTEILSENSRSMP